MVHEYYSFTMRKVNRSWDARKRKKPYSYLTAHLIFIVYVSSRLKHFFLISLSNNNARKIRILTHYYVGYVYNVYLFDSTQSTYRERLPCLVVATRMMLNLNQR